MFRDLARAMFVSILLLQADPAFAVGEPATQAALTLDEAGHKWAADRHTMESVAAMRATVTAIPAAVSAVDLQAAGRRLDEQMQALIRGCRMTGPAHDQLHVWLLQVIPQIQAFTSTVDVAAGHATLARITKSLEDFEAYFVEAPPA